MNEVELMSAGELFEWINSFVGPIIGGYFHWLETGPFLLTIPAMIAPFAVFWSLCCDLLRWFDGRPPWLVDVLVRRTEGEE